MRALKGVVKLQALVRGQTVRRQVFSTLKHLPSSARELVEVHEINSDAAEKSHKDDKSNQVPWHKKKLEEREIKVGIRNWYWQDMFQTCFFKSNQGAKS